MSKTERRKKRLSYNKKYDEKIRKNRQKVYSMLSRTSKPSKKQKEIIKSLLPPFELKRVLSVAKSRH